MSTTNDKEKPRSIGDQILARARANTAEPKVLERDRKTGATVARQELYSGSSGTKQADLAIAKRQIATGQGIGDPNEQRRKEYLQTTEGKGVKSRAFQEGLQAPTKREFIAGAEARVQAQRDYYTDQPKQPLTAGQRLPGGSRITSVTGRRPPPPTEQDIAARISQRADLTANQRAEALRQAQERGALEYTQQRQADILRFKQGREQAYQYGYPTQEPTREPEPPKVTAAPGTVEYYKQQIAASKQPRRASLTIEKGPEVEGFDPFKS
ncbi:MAG: hypothetical protein ACRD5H_15600, partial [Nitrososphaerales archaeon]